MYNLLTIKGTRKGLFSKDIFLPAKCNKQNHDSFVSDTPKTENMIRSWFSVCSLGRRKEPLENCFKKSIFSQRKLQCYSKKQVSRGKLCKVRVTNQVQPHDHQSFGQDKPLYVLHCKYKYVGSFSAYRILHIYIYSVGFNYKTVLQK